MDDIIVLNKKREFTIRCTPSDGVVIEDGNLKKGGNLRTHAGKAIAWTNATSRPTCFLVFTVLAGDDAANDGAVTWPFSESEPPDKLLELPRGIRTERTLRRGRDAVESVEYVVLDEKKQPLLDPVIIIDPN
jgi:hypothetical protein